MNLELNSFHKALESYTNVLSRATDQKYMSTLDAYTQTAVKAGVIQHFEFTYELCWKFMKRYLEYNLGKSYVEGVARHELFRLAAENHLIDDVEAWINYHKARNLTSHTYDERLADEVFEAGVTFIQDAQFLYEALKSRND